MVRHLLAASVAFVFCTPLLSRAADPDSTSAEARVKELEKQVQELRQTVRDLRRSQTNSTSEISSTNVDNSSALTDDPIARIRDEGLNHSKVMETLGYLSDVIGQRLTGSPNLKRANEWTRDTLAGWGLTNAQVEPWGYFGRGWSLKRFSAQLVEPQTIPLIGQPNAWSPGFDRPLGAKVIFLDATNDAGLEAYKGKLKGAIVLVGQPREVPPRFEPLSTRLTESNLLALANAGPGQLFTGDTNLVRTGFRRVGSARGDVSPGGGDRSTNSGRFGAFGRFGPGGRGLFQTRALSFVASEGAALVVNPSFTGDAGTFFVAAAAIPTASGDTNSFGNRPRPWATNAPPFPAQITLAVEDYNRLVRMSRQGVKLKMAVDLKVEYQTKDLEACNTVAEIPGSDLKDELVMIGAHLDSWHSGTGATDNGAGVAATMEAVRILEALKLQPRRTIRIALWSGEEQGLLGSHAYVSNHFGYYSTNSPAGPNAGDNTDQRSSRRNGRSSGGSRNLVCTPAYEKLSVYFNLDNGAGKIRGIYLQGNDAVRPLFRRWLAPFADLGASTITLSNTGGTDHQSFDGIGLPGFQFIQDPLDYSTRTHHSNEDVFDRIQPDDMKQAATILAAFLYDAAMLDEKLPHKPTD